MIETCKETVGGPWHFKECGKPAKGRGDVIGGKDVSLCGIHLAAIRKRAANDDARARKDAERDESAKHAAALSAARDEVVRAAVAHYDGCSFHHQCVVCAAVAALARLEGKP